VRALIVRDLFTALIKLEFRSMRYAFTSGVTSAFDEAMSEFAKRAARRAKTEFRKSKDQSHRILQACGWGDCD
jgi:hypothetical protein